MSYVKSLQALRKELSYRATKPAPTPEIPSRRGFMGGVAKAPPAPQEELRYNPMDFVTSSMQDIIRARESFQQESSQAMQESARGVAKGYEQVGKAAASVLKGKEVEAPTETVADIKDRDMGPEANMNLKSKPGNANIKEDTKFIEKVSNIAAKYGTTKEALLAVMHFETGGTFSSGVRNAAGSGATGLIQFMPSTAKGLGTSTEALSKMDRLEQLDYVDKYFAQTPLAKGKSNNVEDVYMSVLWPKAVGKPSDYVLFAKGTKAYEENKGLDRDGKGYVTKSDAASKVMQVVESYSAI